MLENVWEGTSGSEKYFEMLRVSVERAERITAQLVEQAGGAPSKVLMHPDLAAFTRPKSMAPAIVAKQRVLVVDDEEMALSICQRVFTDAGFDVVTAQSGFQCLDFFRRRPRDFNLILLDLTMPIMDGEETFRRLRAISHDVPIILATGFVDKERLNRLLSEGLSGFLRKPYGVSEMLLYCNAILDRSRLSRSGAQSGNAASASAMPVP